MADKRPAVPSDREAILVIAVGDAEALRTLNARYGKALAALARRFLGNEADAEEVAAEVLWQAWHEAKSFDPTRGSVSVWLVTLTRSRSIDRLRAIKARGRAAAEEPAPDPAPDPGVEAELAERTRLVRAALADLSSNGRKALELAYFSDLSQSQIAERFEIPLGTVKTRIRAAMIKLRTMLSERHE